MTTFWDKLGISASVICILHCLATPLLVFSLPILEHFFAHGTFHMLVAIVVFPVAIIALWLGYRTHRLTRMLWLGTAGLIFLGLAMRSEYHGTEATVFMLLAGTFLTTAHYLNLRACRIVRGETVQGPRKPRHDHSSGATADRTAHGNLKH